ncbi:hypothetical protein F4811DRAFT_535850 [Daldinia bambusicola]|nr:hypothetical protein F4811DRAFT_535850 [Daldinia bambusicola]
MEESGVINITAILILLNLSVGRKPISCSKVVSNDVGGRKYLLHIVSLFLFILRRLLLYYTNGILFFFFFFFFFSNQANMTIIRLRSTYLIIYTKI